MYTGIDKTTVKGFSIEFVDFKKLNKIKDETNKSITIEQHPDKSYYKLKGGESFEYIRIEDNNIFESFQAGCKKNGGRFTFYAFLSLSIAPLRGNNLKPLTIDEYRRHLRTVFEYLDNEYGVRCDGMENLQFHTIELNTNISLECDFKDYVRVFGTLLKLAPRTYTKSQIIVDRKTNETNTFILKNNSIGVMFYNKGKQLEETYSLDPVNNLLRIEYKFLKARKVKDVFGTNNVSKLSDDHLKEFIIKRFVKDFETPYRNLLIKNRSNINKKINSYRRSYKNWISRMQEYFWKEEAKDGIPALIDINDFLELVKEKDKSNYARNKKKILKSFPESYFNQREKYEEIFVKVGAI